MTTKGVHYYEIVKNNRTEKIGFTYVEVISNIILDGGNKGKSVRDIRLETDVPEKTIRKNLHKLVEMNRITKRQIVSKTKLPNYRYYEKRNWKDIL